MYMVGAYGTNLVVTYMQDIELHNITKQLGVGPFPKEKVAIKKALSHQSTRGVEYKSQPVFTAISNATPNHEGMQRSVRCWLGPTIW